jgi:hypothetical protein
MIQQQGVCQGFHGLSCACVLADDVSMVCGRPDCPCGRSTPNVWLGAAAARRVLPNEWATCLTPPTAAHFLTHTACDASAFAFQLEVTSAS